MEGRIPFLYLDDVIKNINTVEFTFNDSFYYLYNIEEIRDIRDITEEDIIEYLEYNRHFIVHNRIIYLNNNYDSIKSKLKPMIEIMNFNCTHVHNNTKYMVFWLWDPKYYRNYRDSYRFNVNKYPKIREGLVKTFKDSFRLGYNNMISLHLNDFLKYHNITLENLKDIIREKFNETTVNKFLKRIDKGEFDHISEKKCKFCGLNPRNAICNNGCYRLCFNCISNDGLCPRCKGTQIYGYQDSEEEEEKE